MYARSLAVLLTATKDTLTPSLKAGTSPQGKELHIETENTSKLQIIRS